MTSNPSFFWVLRSFWLGRGDLLSNDKQKLFTQKYRENLFRNSQQKFSKQKLTIRVGCDLKSKVIVASFGDLVPTDDILCYIRCFQLEGAVVVNDSLEFVH